MLRLISSYSSLSKDINNKVWHFIRHNRESEVEKLKDNERSELFDILAYTGVIKPCWRIKIDMLKRIENNYDEIYFYGDNDKLMVRLCPDPDDLTTHINVRWAC